MPDTGIIPDVEFCKDCATFIEGAYAETEEREKHNVSKLQSSNTYDGEVLIQEYWTEYALTLPKVRIHQCIDTLTPRQTLELLSASGITPQTHVLIFNLEGAGHAHSSILCVLLSRQPE